MKVPFLNKPKGEKPDEELMKEIMRNVKATANPTYTISKLVGLCRVSFLSTYGRHFQGSTETLWWSTK